MGIGMMGTFDVINKKLVIGAIAAVLFFGSIGFFEDAYAGNGPEPFCGVSSVIFTSFTICWTGGGDGSSWDDPENWADNFTGEARLPECGEIIEISGGAVVHLNIDFAVCGGWLEIFDGSELIIDAGNTLTEEGGERTILINCGSTLTVLGILDNFGTVDLFCDSSALTNSGQVINHENAAILISGIYSNDGPTTNDGFIHLLQEGFMTLDNGDVINNNGYILIDFGETLNNNDGGVINNFGSGIFFGIDNFGTVNNNEGGTINNDGDIINGDTGEWFDHGTFNNNGGGHLTNDFRFDVGGGTLNNEGMIVNEARLRNNDVEATINNEESGFISNNGRLFNSGTFNNDGIIENTRIITNDGVLNNNEGGSIDNDAGTINNNIPGIITNRDDIFNGGETINNFDTIINECEGEIIGDIPLENVDSITFNRSCNGPLYSISATDLSIFEIDPTDATEVSEFGIGVAEAGYGLATNPLTGKLWGLVGEPLNGQEASRGILTIDPIAETNSALIPTDRADLSDIAFDSSGTLFGITDEECCPGPNEASTTQLVEIDTLTGDTTDVCEINSEVRSEIPNTIGFNFADGFLYRAIGDVNEATFQKITDTSGEECVTVEQAERGDGEEDEGSNYQALTWGTEEEKFFAADADACCTLFDLILDGINSWAISFIGEFDGMGNHASHGLAFIPSEVLVASAPLSVGGGGDSHEPPTIGLNNKGMPIVKCGVMFDSTCFDITSKFHYEFELYEMMSGTHTISITTYCAQGVDKCSYVALAIMPYDEDMNNAIWKIELHKDHLGNLTPVIYDPEGFLGEVTITANVLGGKFWFVSFTIDFKNKDTDPMKFGIQVRDNKLGVQNTYLNEGVQFNDAHAYPYIETAFEAPLEVEPLCIGEDVFHRGNCAFDKVKEWATNNAEETMRQIMNNEHTYK